MTDRIGLSESDIRALLQELSLELESRGIRGQMFLVGGAAMAARQARSADDLRLLFPLTGFVSVEEAQWWRRHSGVRWARRPGSTEHIYPPEGAGGPERRKGSEP